jgi:hypothetical protein
MEEEVFIGARLISATSHEFLADEIEYIESNGSTIEKVRTALGKVPPDRVGEGYTIDALIGEANGQDAQPEGAQEASAIDPESNNQPMGEAGADTAAE